MLKIMLPYFIFIMLLGLFVNFADTSLGGSSTLLDLTKNFPVEQQEDSYILYINENPFKVPYIVDKNPDNGTSTYYFPAEKLLNALGATGNYDNEKNVILINQREFPLNKAALGLDFKTNEKILYLSFKDVLTFLDLPVRIQESSVCTSYHTRTDGQNPGYQTTPLTNAQKRATKTPHSINVNVNRNVSRTPVPRTPFGY